jgi:hypothetical protein
MLVDAYCTLSALDSVGDHHALQHGARMLVYFFIHIFFVLRAWPRFFSEIYHRMGGSGEKSSDWFMGRTTRYLTHEVRPLISRLGGRRAKDFFVFFLSHVSISPPYW